VLSNHANNFYPADDGESIILFGGVNTDSYVSVSLPRGYRFTGYKIVVQNNVTKAGSGDNALEVGHKSDYYFGETNAAFAYRTDKYVNIGQQVSDKEYTVERTSSGDSDMGNVLYFKLANGVDAHGTSEYMGCTLKHVEFTFTAEEGATTEFYAFDHPMTGGVSYDSIAFTTGKLDMGQVEAHYYRGVTRESYYYNNVTDLKSHVLFYEEAAVDTTLPLADRKVGTAPGNKSITRAFDASIGNYYYQIKSGNTYYVEAPIEAVQTGGDTIPLHYRITDAYFHFIDKIDKSYTLIYADELQNAVYGEYYYVAKYVGDGKGSYSMDQSRERAKDSVTVDGVTYYYAGYTTSGSWPNYTYTYNGEYSISGSKRYGYTVENVGEGNGTWTIDKSKQQPYRDRIVVDGTTYYYTGYKYGDYSVSQTRDILSADTVRYYLHMGLGEDDLGELSWSSDTTAWHTTEEGQVFHSVNGVRYYLYFDITETESPLLTTTDSAVATKFTQIYPILHYRYLKSSGSGSVLTSWTLTKYGSYVWMLYDGSGYRYATEASVELVEAHKKIYYDATDDDGNTTRYYLTMGTSEETNNYTLGKLTWSPEETTYWHQGDDGQLYTSWMDVKYYLMADTTKTNYVKYTYENRGKTVTPSIGQYLYTTTKLEYANIFAHFGEDGVYYTSMGTKCSIGQIETTGDTAVIVWDGQRFMPTYHLAGGVEFDPGGVATEYQVNIYDKTGTSYETITVPYMGSVDYELHDLNNDAVKFEVVSPTGSDQNAFFRIDLTMESLNPYIDQLSVICKDVKGNGAGLSVQQKFTSDDFLVGGGDFYFNLPDICEGDNCEIHFGELYSKYGDKTYYTGTKKEADGHARYSFVLAEYYDQFDAGEDYNIYTNRDAAADHDYSEKVFTTTVGSKRFKFNNTEDLNNTKGYLVEYPFSVDKYVEQGGNFKTVEFEYITSTWKTDSAFVFVSDETRYNIAPTTGTQHRYYAYYDINMHVRAESGTPKLTWTKLYNKEDTYYGKGKQQDFYGLQPKVESDTWHACFTDNGTLYRAIVNELDSAKKNSLTDIPTSLDQVLYLDLSKLIGMLEVNYNDINTDNLDAETKAKVEENRKYYITLDSIRNNMAPNALVFMPENQTYDADNFVVLTDSASQTFKGVLNLNIEDKQPFYSPYKFQIDAANTANYTRSISSATGKKSSQATLMLPFTVSLNSEGKHVNSDGSTILFSKLQEDNCMSSDTTNIGDYIGNTDEVDNEGQDFTEYVHFIPVTDSWTEANQPYFVSVSGYGGSKANFAIAQKGATVYPTDDHKLQQTLEGVSSTGSINTTDDNGNTQEASFTFKEVGTYTGAKLTPSESQVFYFAQNRFYNIKNLKYPNLVIYPYRSWYEYEGSSSANIALLGFVFGENLDTDDDVTGIVSVAAETTQPDLAVIPGYHSLTLCANKEQRVTVYSVKGSAITTLSLLQGSVETIQVPSGVYVVNGKKILVK